MHRCSYLLRNGNCNVTRFLFSTEVYSSKSFGSVGNEICEETNSERFGNNGSYNGNQDGRKETKYGVVRYGVLAACVGFGAWKYGTTDVYALGSESNKLSIEGRKDVILDQKSVATAKAAPAEQYIPPARPDLPVYSRLEISKRKSPSKTGIWVSYGSGIYDITEFVDSHPGGQDKIMLAAGGSLEPFWSMYAQHKTSEVAEILEQYRIGNLDPKDVATVVRKDEQDPYFNDPQRHPALLVNSETPFNAETPPVLLTDSFNTPQDIFYVRNHLPVPKMKIDSYKLSVEGGRKRVDFGWKDLQKKFRPVTVTVAIQCAGNRRTEMSKVQSVKGLSWGYTAIGNAKWTGYTVKDILEYSGVELKDFNHVIFEGSDKDMIGTHYETSITMEKALDPDTILAFQMNGEDLSEDHGYPLRLIAPGIVGARQVKWLRGIRLSKEESESHWQRKDYRAFSPSADISTVDYTTSPSIQEGPVTSAICFPLPDTIIDKDADEVELGGYAWSGGGRGIVRVEVSVDGGRTWTTAELQREPSQNLDKMWAWTLWKATVPISTAFKGRKPKSGEALSIVCKATDRSYNTQPETVNGIWNFRGLLNNSWHRIQMLIE